VTAIQNVEEVQRASIALVDVKADLEAERDDMKRLCAKKVAAAKAELNVARDRGSSMWGKLVNTAGFRLRSAWDAARAEHTKAWEEAMAAAEQAWQRRRLQKEEAAATAAAAARSPRPRVCPRPSADVMRLEARGSRQTQLPERLHFDAIGS
jgi:hypothetical protein